MRASSFLLLVFLGFAYCQQPTDPTRGGGESVVKQQRASPVKCYQCNSDNDNEEECAKSDKVVLEKYIKKCPRLSQGNFAGKEATSCRKVLQEVVDNSTVVRECAYSGEALDGKRRTGNKGVTLHLYQCFNENNEEPCNASSKLALSTLLMLIVTFFVAVKI